MHIINSPQLATSDHFMFGLIFDNKLWNIKNKRNSLKLTELAIRGRCT